MKRLFWLLLAALPLITGITFAEGKFILPDGKTKFEFQIQDTDATAYTDGSTAMSTIAFFSTENTPAKETQEIIVANALIGAINAQQKGTNIIKNFWIPEPENDFVGEAMKANPINAASLIFQFEEIPDDENLPSIPLNENNEFQKAEQIRAIANIRGMSITGPVVVFYKDAIDTKKMQAAYALMGQVIAARTAWFTGTWDGRESLRIPDSSMLFDRRSGNNQAKGTFLGQETDLVDYTGTSSDGTVQFRTVVETLIDFLKKIMVPLAIVLVAYGGITLFLSFQNDEKMDAKIRHLTGILVGFLIMTLAVHFVDWIIFGHEGEIMRGEVDIADFARRGFEEASGLFDMFASFAVIIAIGFIVYNAITLILAGGEDEGQISEIKKRILYSMIGIILIVSVKPIIDVFTANGQLVMPDVRGTITIIAKWLNFILGFVGVAAVIAMIYAGISMIIHFGDDTQIENAKKIMISAAIGLVLAFSSWTLVYYFIFAG